MTREPRRKLAVVLLNLGGPDGPDAVEPFLRNLFSDPAIIGLPAIARLPLARLIARRRRGEATANYAVMGGGSPLLPETERQAAALRAALDAELPDREVRVEIAMRYWRPFTEEAARAVADWGAEEIVLLPLYPEFSTTTTESSLAAFRKAYGGSAEVRTVCCYPDLDGLADAHARRIEEAWAAAGRPLGLRLLFSAHGVPERLVARGDPYQWQVERTVEAVAARLPQFPDRRLCYQSRVGPLRWLGPSTPEALQEAARDGVGVILSPVAFVSEHVETLVELDRDYRDLAVQSGVPTYVRAPALGVEPAFVGALAQAVMEALAAPPRTAPAGCGGRRVCPAQFGRCPVPARAAA